MSAGNFYKARTGVACVLMAMLTACGGNGSGDSATNSNTPGTGGPSAQGQSGVATVAISWNANHETGVNSAGGGYLVAVSGQPVLTVPYTSGTSAPTSTTLSLPSGTYTISVSAYAALDAHGGTSGSTSAPQTITVSVP
jgi:hypothetical protein